MLIETLALCVLAWAPEPVWIAPPPGMVSSPPRLRRSITLAEAPSTAKVRVIGLGHYELRCNGTVVGDGVINQAWSQYDETLYWQEFDVGPLLRRGENVLAVTLGDSFWRVGPVNDPGRFSKTDATPDFSDGWPYLLWMDGSATVGTATVPIVTDAGNGGGWTVGPSPLRFSHIYAGEDFDARLDEPGWDRPGFVEGTGWVRAVAAPAPKGVRAGLPSPNLRTFEVFKAAEIRPIDGRTWTYVFPQNSSSLLRFSVEGAPGQRVRFRPCEYMQADGRVKFTYTWGTGKDIWHDYTLAGNGVERHQTVFCYVGAQFVQVEGAVPEGRPNPEGLPVLRDLELVHTRVACPEVGTFASDSVIQNGAHRLVDWSIRSNMSWVPTDCPHREKNGWLEQNWHMARSMSYRYDIQGWFTKTCRDMLDAQLSTGADDGFVPTNAPWYLVGRPVHDTYNDAPEWGVASVLVPWHLYEWYGVTKPLETNYAGMKRYVDYLSRTAKDGVITSNLGDWYDYGHGKGDGPSQWTPAEVSATAIWALGAKTVADTAGVLGKKDDEAAYRGLYDRIRATFIKKFYDPATHQVKNGGSCQAGNAAALCIGLVPESDRSAVVGEILADLKARGYQQTTGEVLHVFLVRALAEQGPGWGGKEGADALHRVYAREERGSYGFMVKSGLTTLPESWDARPGTGNSLSHLMLGHLMEWHFAYVAGIRRELGAVGWNRVVFAPQIPPIGEAGSGPMRTASARVRTPSGLVDAGWRIEAADPSKPGGEIVRMWCEIPAGVSAVARLPDGTQRELGPGRHELSCPRQ